MACIVVHVNTARQYFLIILLYVLSKPTKRKCIFLTRMNKQMLRWTQIFFISVHIDLPITFHQVYFSKISIMLQVGHDVLSISYMTDCQEPAS